MVQKSNRPGDYPDRVYEQLENDSGEVDNSKEFDKKEYGENPPVGEPILILLAGEKPKHEDLRPSIAVFELYCERYMIRLRSDLEGEVTVTYYLQDSKPSYSECENWLKDYIGGSKVQNKYDTEISNFEEYTNKM